MENIIVNKETSEWLRPWNLEKFDDLYNRDERYFSILLKGVISWLNRNIVLYNKSINHFIFNTGSSYMYIENNGYELNWSETTGEDQMYMHMPRCVIEIADINIPTEELTQPFSRGFYERRENDQIKGFNAEIQRLPIELSLNLKYVLSNFNEVIILLQELLDKIIFQKYFNITYLGQVIECSIELPQSFNPQINKIDMSSPEINQRTIDISIKICSNYPIVNARTEISSNKLINRFANSINLYNKDDIFFNDDRHETDKESHLTH